MAGVKFYPERRSDKAGNLITKNVPLFLFYSLRGKRLIYFTGERFDLGDSVSGIVKGKEKTTFKNWDDNKMLVVKSVTSSQKINAQISALRNIIENAEIRAAKTQETLTHEYLKRELDLFTGKVEEAKPEVPEALVPVIAVNPQAALDEWVIDRTENESPASVKNIRVFRNHINAYLLRDYTDFTFDDIEEVFYDGFRKFLRNTLHHAINTEAKYTKYLSRFLKFCDKRKYITNYAYKNFDWVSEDAPDVITLDLDEVALLESAVMPTPALERIRNTFLFQLYCGMRFADVENLKKVDWQGDFIKFFILKKTKGRIEHVVPVSSKAKAILKLYKDIPGDRLLPVLSNQKTNDGLKEVGKAAGLDQIVKKKVVYGNKAVITPTPKYQLLSTHMARKGFITIAISKNIIEAKIKSITGHEKNSRAFGRYYEVSAKDKKATVDEIFGV